jgi:uncharacterized spore protein YtfJ
MDNGKSGLDGDSDVPFLEDAPRASFDDEDDFDIPLDIREDSPGTVNETLGHVRDAVERGVAAANVSSVFGEPYKIGEKLVIPVADVRLFYGLGGGEGQGFASSAGKAESEGTPPTPPSGSGGGGGGASFASPVAIIEVDGGEVRIKPITNARVMALAGMLLAAWNLYWFFRMMREVMVARAYSHRQK